MQELELLHRQGKSEVAANQVLDQTASNLPLLLEASERLSKGLKVRRGAASTDLARRNHLDDSLVGCFFICFDKLPPQTIDQPFYQCVELAYHHCQISLEKETISKKDWAGKPTLKSAIDSLLAAEKLNSVYGSATHAREFRYPPTPAAYRE